MSRHLRRDPRVRTGHPNDLRRFLHGAVYLVRTGHPLTGSAAPLRSLEPCLSPLVPDRGLGAYAGGRGRCPDEPLAGASELFSHVRSHVRGARKDKLKFAVGVATTPSCTFWSTSSDGRCVCIRPRAKSAPRPSPSRGWRDYPRPRAGGSGLRRRSPAVLHCRTGVAHRQFRGDTIARYPSTTTRNWYREHHTGERGIGWFKQGCRLATRFEKTASSYLGSWCCRRLPLAAKPLRRYCHTP